MKHKRNLTREQVQTEINCVKAGLQRAYYKTQELLDVMKVTDARTRQRDRDRCSIINKDEFKCSIINKDEFKCSIINKDEFKLLSETIDLVIAVLPMLTRLLRYTIRKKLGGR